MRKIVMLHPREWLREAYRSGAPMGVFADKELRADVKQFDGVAPIALPTAPVTGADAVRIMTSPTPVQAPHAFMVAAEFEDEAEERAFQSQNPHLVAGIYADPAIEPFSVACPLLTTPVGTGGDALATIGAPSVHGQGLQGQGIRVVVVDTGIDATVVPVSGGYNLFPGIAPGQAVGGHGTMVAANVRLVAPHAQLFDCPLLRTQGAGWVALLSDAILAYSQVLVTLLQQPGPIVVVNSWGMYQRTLDAPPGHPQNYSANPQHPFNLIVGTLAQAGADVVFAAGNCGQHCPDARCGQDVGPGSSIHGANSHPDVLSVAAVTHLSEFLGYSSQGGGGLTAQKPDVAAPSHYAHSGVYPADAGTSTACPVVAGALALLRCKPTVRSLPAAQLRAALRATARQPTGYAAGWNADTGHGVIDVAAAIGTLP